MSRTRVAPGQVTLLALTFTSGMTTMAVEMAGSRLLAPFFGNSLIIWAILIGLIMVYLTAGYYLGGWLSDRYPSRTALFRLTSLASLAIALVPWISRPILAYATDGFADSRWGLLVSSFIGVVALFSLPMVLLGCVSPFAIRLSMRGLHATGRVAGGIYAISSMGSIVGTFLPVFWLIPTIGTRSTFWLFALALATLSIIGLAGEQGRRFWPYLAVPLLIIALWLLGRPGLIKVTPGAIYETESTYNYIQVLRVGDAYILKLNEGEGNQSVYVPGRVLLYRIFDYFLAAPLFRAADAEPMPRNVCIIGLAGGTMAKQYTEVFGPVPIDGVEIDPKLIEVARDYFALDMPNLQAHALDGRHFLRTSGASYDVIMVDAYRPPYIPFHLTTVEFFAEAHARLADDGVVAVNVARTDQDYSLIDAIASTMLAVFARVHIVDAPESYNSMIVGTRAAVTPQNIVTQADRLTDPLLQDVARRMFSHLREFSSPTGAPLRDDRAPVESIIHDMIWRFVWEG